MRRFPIVFAAAVLAAGVVLGDTARAQDEPDDTRRSMGNLRPDHRTAAPAIQGSPPPRVGIRRRPVPYLPPPNYVVPYPGYGPGYWYDEPYYPPGYGYDPYLPYPYPYPPPYYWGPRYIPPVFIPAERLFGPEAMKRFMGVAEPNRPAPGGNVIVAPRAGDPQADEQPILRATNPESIARGWRFIGFGDAHFANQKCADAYQRYKKAAQAAPTLAAAYFRQGYALVALGRYELAARALRRGLELDPGWPQSNFRNDEVYGDNLTAKTAHLNALAQAATNQPHNADLPFLLGVYLHFDGQRDRAAPFFQRAAGLAGAAAAHLRGFLEQPEPPPP